MRHLVNWAGTTWSYHPIQAAAAAVWIQVGIGVWLIVAARGALSRLAGTTAVAWGLVVWVFGESFGGIFAPGLTWLMGAPGAVWQALPALPAGRTVTLALPASGGTDALAAKGSTLTAWYLAPGAASWSRTQVTNVPIQYGSSA